jgi:YfiH family protein
MVSSGTELTARETRWTIPSMVKNNFVLREANGVPLYVCRALESVPGLRHGFSTRRGGISALPQGALNLTNLAWDSPEAVHENRRRFLSAVGLEHAELATLSQIHSDRIHIIEQNRGGRNTRPRADAQMTRLRGIALGVQVADCFPILIADRVMGSIAAVHAGWRGTAERIVSKTVTAIQRTYGSDPRDLLVAIGPGIRACCFEVGPEVLDVFRHNFPEMELPPGNFRGPAHLDLSEAIAIQLVEAGVEAGNVFDLESCTRCGTAEFFSYRGEGVCSGRMMAVIGWACDPQVPLQAK